ncbi:MAG: glycoside hydrolase family protein [Desulfuromonadaceae bacterium]
MNNVIDPQFYLGVVEDRQDPLMLGRVRVRVLGLHTHDKTLLPTEDLPWAYKVQPSTSGGISGIGHAPVGVMEGTWVMIQYIDPDKQMPFVVGVIGGIPQSQAPALESFTLVDEQQSGTLVSSDGSAVTSSDGSPVATEATKTDDEKLTEVQDSKKFRKASEFKVSDEIVNKLKKSESFKSCPYDDGVGVMTIGYGSTYLNDNSKVTKNTPCITEAEADSLMRYKLAKDFEPAVKRNVRVPVSQEMYDSMVHLAYNVGGGGFGVWSRESGLNSGDYTGAATHMQTFRVNPGTKTEKGLRNRRAYESKLFLSGGIPDKEGTKQDTPESVEKDKATTDTESQQNDPTRSETAEQNFGYQNAIFTDPRGFKDPSDKYPRKSQLDEPDTSRLARHQRIRDTIVYLKELAEHKGVEKANGKGEWDQSPTPYNAKYPYNNVWESESGHVMEYDDTEGRERIHMWHRKGTFTEIDHNGTYVRRTVGNDYTILEKNGHVHIVGSAHVCVEGAKTLLIKDALDVEVRGNTTINCHSDAKINVANNLDITTGGSVNWKVGGNFAVDAARIDLNSGVASGLSTVGAKGGSAGPDFGSIPVMTRGDEIGVEYETMESDPAVVYGFKKKMIQEGVASKEELDAPVEKKAEETPAENKVDPKPSVCGIPGDQKTFTGNEQLSPSYKLKDLTFGRKIVPDQGFSEAQVFCNLKALAENVLEPIRAKYPNIKINSGYRNFVPPGGAKNSQHMTGQAVDIGFGVDRSKLYDIALEVQKLVPYDQLILEHTTNGNGWVHVSFNMKGNKKQHFTMNNHKRVGNMGTITKIF